MDRNFIEARDRLEVIPADLYLVLELSQRSDDSHIAVRSASQESQNRTQTADCRSARRTPLGSFQCRRGL